MRKRQSGHGRTDGEAGRAEGDAASLDANMRAWIRKQLLGWYDRHRRDLPWRRRAGDGYAQLVAEFMLQQTQVATVVPYYERFLTRFPTVGDLAEAELDDVLALWSGLGYYRRARNLHAAAQAVTAEHGGEVPAEVASLIALPGVGRYTAGAIASITYDTRAAVLDGNVGRVLLRVVGVEADPKSSATAKMLWGVAERLLPARRCGDFNQALMELGATVCTPRSPACESCPLRARCRALEEDRVERIPSAGTATPVLPATLVVAAVRAGERYLFVQRPPDGLWAGLWELPSEEAHNGDIPSLRAARDRLRRRLGLACRLSTHPTAQVTRLLSHRRVRFHIYQGTARAAVDARHRHGPPRRWLSRDQLGTIGISRACEAVLASLGWPAR